MKNWKKWLYEKPKKLCHEKLEKNKGPYCKGWKKQQRPYEKKYNLLWPYEKPKKKKLPEDKPKKK